MNIGMYTATSQLEAMGKNHEIIARNLANANTAGYKTNIASFKTIMLGGGTDGAPEISGTKLDHIDIDFRPGKMQHTGNDFDIAIKGEGFFTIQSKSGLVYSRRGQFIISPEQEIITPSGDRLMGRGGPIQIPPGTKKISVDAAGLISADGRNIGELQITQFPNMKSLTQIGSSAFKPEDPGNIGEDAEDFEVAQGYVERSNVDVIGEMVNMISNLRGYQMGQRSLTKSMSDTLTGLIKLAAQAG